MASAFWTLEDGRTYARRWSGMAYMLEIITDELRDMEGAQPFYDYLEYFVYREENGDEYNGIGGFIRRGENIDYNFDLRTFAPQNRDHFWLAAQRALAKLASRSDTQADFISSGLGELLDMHERILRGEDPMQCNHVSSVEPDPGEKLGPGW